jgi:hypothetical protein
VITCTARSASTSRYGSAPAGDHQPEIVLDQVEQVPAGADPVVGRVTGRRLRHVLGGAMLPAQHSIERGGQIQPLLPGSGALLAAATPGHGHRQDNLGETGRNPMLHISQWQRSDPTAQPVGHGEGAKRVARRRQRPTAPPSQPGRPTSAELWPGRLGRHRRDQQQRQPQPLRPTKRLVSDLIRVDLHLHGGIHRIGPLDRDDLVGGTGPFAVRQ